MSKGYDLFGDHGRNLPAPHGSGSRPMYADMGKSCRPDPNRVREYPYAVALFTIDSHNTSYFYKRENGTYYWHHCRKNKDDIYTEAEELQLNLFGTDPILPTDYIMKEILAH